MSYIWQGLDPHQYGNIKVTIHEYISYNETIYVVIK